MLLAVFGFVGDCVDQNKSQGGVVVGVAAAVAIAVAIADTRTDPEKGSAAEVVAPAVEEEEEAPVSSSVPCLGSTCLDLDWVVEGG